jgi:DNA-binding Lrp family transcriptional regulator
MQRIALDVIDRRLLHALQIEPRASWQTLAPVVGVDASTLARRWARLEGEGIAWVTGHPTHGQTALLEIECELAHVEAVMRELRSDPWVYVLDFSSGSRDLLVLLLAPDLPSLSEYTVGRLGELAGIRTIRTHLASEVLIDGSSWRLRELEPEEAGRIRAPQAPRPRAARRVPEDVREAIVSAVWEDGRMPVATIAERSGISAQRISDGLATMRQTGAVRFRTDLARAASGWPVYTWYFVDAPSHVLEAAKSTIASVPEVRLAFTAASRHNLVLAVWLRRLADVNRFELALENALPGARIADRAVVMRIAKHMNRAVGPDTRATGPA